jgi:hypothetical protein
MLEFANTSTTAPIPYQRAINQAIVSTSESGLGSWHLVQEDPDSLASQPKCNLAPTGVAAVAIPTHAVKHSHLHIDIGAEGRYPRAINLNPQPVTTTGVGIPVGSPIPNRVAGVGQQMPFPAGFADVITVENTPIMAGMAGEIARVIKPGGRVRLFHPTDSSTPYGNLAHAEVARTVGGRAYTYNSPDGATTTLIVAPP